LETARELVEDQVQEAREAQRFVSPLLTPVPRAIMDPGAVVPRVKRKVSKANKAVKHAMSLLKGGTKASTGADKGKLAKGAFKMAVKAAGLANPNTPSKIKGKGKVKALARKIRKWW
jgi:predicted GNAT family acetyltransferase